MPVCEKTYKECVHSFRYIHLTAANADRQTLTLNIEKKDNQPTFFGRFHRPYA
jgi:hypothetical protein